MSEENVELVRRLWSLWESGPDQGDPSGPWTHGLAAPDALLRPPPEVPDMPTYIGRDGFLDFLGFWTEAFEDWTIRAEQIIDAGGSRVVAVTHQSGIGKESGAPVELHVGIVYTIEEGQVTETAMYLTPEQALEAAGISE